MTIFTSKSKVLMTHLWTSLVIGLIWRYSWMKRNWLNTLYHSEHQSIHKLQLLKDNKAAKRYLRITPTTRSLKSPQLFFGLEKQNSWWCDSTIIVNHRTVVLAHSDQKPKGLHTLEVNGEHQEAASHHLHWNQKKTDRPLQYLHHFLRYKPSPAAVLVPAAAWMSIPSIQPKKRQLIEQQVHKV